MIEVFILAISKTVNEEVANDFINLRYHFKRQPFLYSTLDIDGDVVYESLVSSPRDLT